MMLLLTDCVLLVPRYSTLMNQTHIFLLLQTKTKHQFWVPVLNATAAKHSSKLQNAATSNSGQAIGKDCHWSDECTGCLFFWYPVREKLFKQMESLFGQSVTILVDSLLLTCSGKSWGCCVFWFAGELCACVLLMCFAHQQNTSECSLDNKFPTLLALLSLHLLNAVKFCLLSCYRCLHAQKSNYYPDDLLLSDQL